MNEELTTFIIKELGKHQDRKEIIRKVCERGGLDGKSAERLLILVESQHKYEIASRQTPMLLLLSIGTLFVGIGLLAFNIQMLVPLFQKDLLAQILVLQSSSYRLIGSLTGLTMTISGLVGLWKAFGEIFPEEKKVSRTVRRDQ